ncbi:MAG: glutamate-5-semialdehyde dehydrogenase [Saprospiraceae bacterium]|nr:glutamate-5-semialdehyde dehydrogenase [Saprospiraceae bacterium]HRK81143.1 glutamate-5-semialdehyde dehydrogenase [Saprospiraceae bacterium]
MIEQLRATHAAAAQIRRLSDAAKTKLLLQLAQAVEAACDAILAANQLDLAKIDDADPKKDRLLLNPERIAALAGSIREVAALRDPCGAVLLDKILPNGLKLRKISVPLGVVGIIYESRPNVTLDVSALCLRSGNAAVLRGGSDALQTNRALAAIIQDVLEQAGLSRDVVALLPPDRELVKDMLTATRYIDVIIPRGSDALIRFVRENSLVPVIETGAGVCHTYVHESADLEKAKAIVVNAKVSRPSVCNSLDTIVIDSKIAPAFLPLLRDDFEKWKVEVFADPVAFDILQQAGFERLQPASESDFGREFLDYKCSVKTVNGLPEALDHIRTYSSRHSEAIVAEDTAVCRTFLEETDAAAVFANASTRFTDGGMFGLGAEIGISTQKLHARGPFALEKLVTEKWVVEGEGQVRW